MTSRSLIADIHHVSINVSDLDRAQSFYVDVLGLKVLPRPDLGIPGCWLDSGSGRQVHLIQTDNVPSDVGQHFAFLVEDIGTSCSQLAERGVRVRGPKPVGKGWQAFFHDPDGNRIEFNQPS